MTTGGAPVRVGAEPPWHMAAGPGKRWRHNMVDLRLVVWVTEADDDDDSYARSHALVPRTEATPRETSYHLVIER